MGDNYIFIHHKNMGNRPNHRPGTYSMGLIVTYYENGGPRRTIRAQWNTWFRGDDDIKIFIYRMIDTDFNHIFEKYPELVFNYCDVRAN